VAVVVKVLSMEQTRRRGDIKAKELLMKRLKVLPRCLGLMIVHRAVLTLKLAVRPLMKMKIVLQLLEQGPLLKPPPLLLLLMRWRNQLPQR
jgi:hypothetical protein